MITHQAPTPRAALHRTVLRPPPAPRIASHHLGHLAERRHTPTQHTQNTLQRTVTRHALLIGSASHALAGPVREELSQRECICIDIVLVRISPGVPPSDIFLAISLLRVSNYSEWCPSPSLRLRPHRVRNQTSPVRVRLLIQSFSGSVLGGYCGTLDSLLM